MLDVALMMEVKQVSTVLYCRKRKIPEASNFLRIPFTFSKNARPHVRHHLRARTPPRITA